MKRALIGAAILILASAGSLAAQPPGGSKIGFNVGGGVTVPLNSGLSDNYKAGFNFGGSVDYAVLRNLLVFGDVRYHRFGIKSGAFGFPSNASISGGGETIFSAVAGAKYVFPSPGKIHFYVFAGTGISHQSQSDVTAQYTVVTSYYTATVSSTKSLSSTTGLGVIAGPGLWFDLTPKVAVYGELRYASCVGTNMYVPFVVGVRIAP
jgi:hypothetical protein